MSIVFTWARDMSAIFVSVTLMFSIACFGVSFPDRTESTMIHHNAGSLFDLSLIFLPERKHTLV
jgi:hypothetical protein